MITGKKTFEVKSHASLMAAILQHEPGPMSSLQPKAPVALQRMVETCLAKDPRNRWQTAHDVMLQLQWILDGGSQHSIPAPVIQPRKSGQRLVWALLTVAVVALAAVSALYFAKSPTEL